MKTTHIIMIYLIFIALITSSSAQENARVELPEYAIARLGKGGVNIINFSPDGTRLAIGTSIGVWIYNVETEIGSALPVGNIRYFNSLAFSTDGKILAAGGIINPGIQIWDTETGNKISTIKLPDRFHRISELTFAEENKTLIGLGANRNIIRWDVNSGNEISQKEVYFDRPIHAFSSDGTSFVSGHKEKCEIRLWITESGLHGNLFQEKTDLATVAPLPSYAVEKPEKRNVIGGVQAIAYSPDKNTIASAHNNNCIRIWDIPTKLERYTLQGHTEKINTVAFSSDSKIVASGSYDNTIHLWDVDKGKLKNVLIEHKNAIKALAFSPTENGLLASGSRDGTVRLWDVNNGKQESIFASGFTETIEALAFTKDNKMLVSTAENGTIQMWDANKGKELPFPSNRHYDITDVAVFSQDATLFAGRGAETFVESDGSGVSKRITPQKVTRLWQLPIETELFSIPHRTSALCISHDNKLIAIGNEYETVLYDIESKEELHRFDASHFFNRNAVGISPDNTIIAIGGDPGEVILWDVKTGEKLDTLHNPFVGEATSFVFSRDGSILIARYSGRIRIWDMHTRKQLYSTLVEKVMVADILALSPDGQLLLTAKWHHESGSEIQLWDVRAESKLINLQGHSEQIESMVFSHDGKVLATGGKDGSILLWDWDQILDKIGRENIGIIANQAFKTDKTKPTYKSKAEEGKAIMKWLEDQEYELQKIGDRCKIAQGKSRVTMISARGGAVIMQNLKFEFSRDGILRITVKDIGTAEFDFDDKGELKVLQSE